MILTTKSLLFSFLERGDEKEEKEGKEGREGREGKKEGREGKKDKDKGDKDRDKRGGSGRSRRESRYFFLLKFDSSFNTSVLLNTLKYKFRFP